MESSLMERLASANLTNFRYQFRLSKTVLDKNFLCNGLKIAESTRLQLDATGYSSRKYGTPKLNFSGQTSTFKLKKNVN